MIGCKQKNRVMMQTKTVTMQTKKIGCKQKAKNCHDASKKDRMQTKQLFRYEADLVRRRGYSFWPDMKWEAGSGQAIVIDQYLKMYCRFYI